MSSPNTNDPLDHLLKQIEGLPKAHPSEAFEDRLFARIATEQVPVQEKIPRWMRWSVAALITLAITNVLVLTNLQETPASDELEALWYEQSDTDYYYGQELLTAVEP